VRSSVREVAALFLRLGVTAFGGPAAHVAMMEDEVVRRRGWISRAELLDLVGATQLVPGPNSTELAIHLGLRRAGWPGFLVAGACFILPAALLVTALAWAHATYGALPAVARVLAGVKPVIVAVIAQALWGFGRTALRTRPLALLAAGSAAAAALGAAELAVLAVAGLVGGAARAAGGERRGGLAAALPAMGGLAAPAAALHAAAPFTLGGLFLVFLKIGSVLFGSGSVLVAFLRAELVAGRGWITEAQLLDAIAIGQVTPGPVFTAATFVGYQLGGLAGAAVATVGIFLPAFAFVAASGPLVPRIRRSPVAGAALDGVNAASVALMAVVTAQLARAAVGSAALAAVAVGAWVLLVRFRVSSTWLVLAGGAVGWLLN
jgi:chromate transporter